MNSMSVEEGDGDGDEWWQVVREKRGVGEVRFFGVFPV